MPVHTAPRGISVHAVGKQFSQRLRRGSPNDSCVGSHMHVPRRRRQVSPIVLIWVGVLTEPGHVKPIIIADEDVRRMGAT